MLDKIVKKPSFRLAFHHARTQKTFDGFAVITPFIHSEVAAIRQQPLRVQAFYGV